MKRPNRGYTLIEIMVAILFVSIGFFGYVALHARILHSGQRLEERESIRAATDFWESLQVARIHLGFQRSLTWADYPIVPGMPDLHNVSTVLEPGANKSALEEYPRQYVVRIDDTLELSPTVYAKPYEYSWKRP